MSSDARVNDPLERFRAIFDRVCALEVKHPNAVALSTVSEGGQPTSRMVLLKDFDERGFTFYTNLESRKGRHLRASGRAGMNFYWREIDEQVIIEGPVAQVSDEEADAYFATRPRGSQVGAWASRQSRPLESRAALVAAAARVEAKYIGRKVPRPPHWSGFRLKPERYEFWCARRFRLHDRHLFERTGDGWRVTRLNP